MSQCKRKFMVIAYAYVSALVYACAWWNSVVRLFKRVWLIFQPYIEPKTYEREFKMKCACNLYSPQPLSFRCEIVVAVVRLYASAYISPLSHICLWCVDIIRTLFFGERGKKQNQIFARLSGGYIELCLLHTFHLQWLCD